tara:strand:+ start:385 stop:1038 length:654 start_codon:yes stop_codon:yes gene_type:complete
MIETDSTGTRIMFMRKKNGLNQAEVCKAGGFHKASYSNWENNRRTPSLIDAKKLEPILNTSASYLLKLTDTPEILGMNKDGTFVTPCPSIPILSDGLLNESTEQEQRYMPFPSFINKDISNYFAYILKDDSMSPDFSVKDIIVLNDKTPIEHNKFILAKLNNSNSLIFRKIYIDNSDAKNTLYKLIPSNKEWPLITIENIKLISIHGVMDNKRKIHI